MEYHDSDAYSGDGRLVLDASIRFTPFDAFWAAVDAARLFQAVTIRASVALGTPAENQIFLCVRRHSYDSWTGCRLERMSRCAW